MSAEVDAYFAEMKSWRDEAAALRKILRRCELEEQIKWRKPCYSHDGDNIAIIQPFKGFLALMFFKGALLEDPDGLLEEQGKNTRSAKRVCFRSVDDVTANQSALVRFVKEAIENERAGLEVPKDDGLALVDELQARLEADPKLKAAFESLTPGRQREYNLHVGGAKRKPTRERRIDKCTPKILAGKGLRDR